MELVVRTLSKQYPHKLAVDRVSLTLTPGIYGLLGANGAGKTHPDANALRHFASHRGGDFPGQAWGLRRRSTGRAWAIFPRTSAITRGSQGRNFYGTWGR